MSIILHFKTICEMKKKNEKIFMNLVLFEFLFFLKDWKHVLQIKNYDNISYDSWHGYTVRQVFSAA